jgi:hypothetical protein
LEIAMTDTVTFEDFGAIGNGEDDDLNAIRLAIAHAQEYRARVRVLAKWYRCSDEILIGAAGPIEISGDTPPRNTPVGVEQTSTLKFDPGKNGIRIESNNGFGPVSIRNLTIFKSGLDAKGTGTTGLRIRALKASQFENVYITGFDVGLDLDSGIGTDAEPQFIAFTNLRIFQGGTYLAHIKGCSDICFNEPKFGGDLGALDALVRISTGSTGGVPDAVHFSKPFFIPSLGQTAPWGLVIDSDEALWITMDRPVFEGTTAGGILINKSTFVYDVGDRVTLFMNMGWADLPARSVPIYSINASINIQNSRLRSTGSNTSAIFLDTTAEAAQKFNSSIVGCDIFTQNGFAISAYKQDGLIVTNNLIGTTGSTPSVGAYIAGACTNLVIDDNRENTNQPSSVAAPGTIGKWSGYARLTVDGNRTKQRRYTGTSNGTGQIDITHSEANAHQRVAMAQAFYRGSSNEAIPMSCSYIDGTNVRFTGATPSTPIRATLWFYEDASGW